MKVLKELSGHSGCKVLLIKDKVNFVRKISSNLNYNNRLKRQMKKQENFKHTFIKTPKVFSCGMESNLFYYDMQYIHGLSLSDYIKRKNIKNIKNKFEHILDFVQSNNELEETIGECVSQKVNSLNIDSEFDYYKDYCLDYDWQKIKKSYCHGDLTFENTIILNENIYLIDFLDSFVDTRITDISKILQELYAFWSLRSQAKKFNIKYIMIDEMLKERGVVDLASIKLLVLNLLRIVPYSGKEDKSFLKDQMNHIIGTSK